MRRVLELIALFTTSVALVATSRAPEPCATEEVTLHIESTCGAPGVVVVSSARDCTAKVVAGADDAGLPVSGTIWDFAPDSGVANGFTLVGQARDAGPSLSCTAQPADGGLALSCEPTCVADGGLCPARCTGTLTP